MKDMVRSYLAKIAEQTEKFSSCLLAERTIEQQEKSAESLKRNFPARQEKASSPTPPEKGKKRRIPFVALALLLVFTSLCILALVGPSTLVSAARAYVSSSTLHQDASTSLDAATPLANCIETNCFGGPTGSSFTGPLLPNASCGGSTFKNASPVIGTAMCADPKDFLWGNLDITCVYDDNLDRQLTNFNNDLKFTVQGNGFGPWWVNPNPNASPNQNQTTPVAGAPHTPPSASFYNQNTCVNGHQCRSDDASLLDSYDPKNTNPSLTSDDLADKTGGDNVICKNDACANIQTSDYTGVNDGTVCGSGIAYDKLACYWIGGNWYYNPTAYAPDGALEEGTTGGDINVKIPRSDLAARYDDKSIAPMYGLHVAQSGGRGGGFQYVDGTLQTSGSDPYCNTPPNGGGVGHWTCNNGSSGAKIVLVMTVGTGTYDSSSVFQSSPMTVQSIMSGGGWTYPPTWSVMCAGTGQQGGEFPCSDISGAPNISVITKDWLSGNTNVTGAAGDTSGHLVLTYNADTVESPNLQKIFGITLALGYLLIAPTVILIGYQMLWSSWTFKRAGAMEAFGRVILSLVAVGISFTLCEMLIGLANLVSTALAAWHQQLGYPQVLINGNYYQYTLAGDTDSGSFRGVVVPVSRWGCLLNDFVGILESKAVGDIFKNIIPFFGGLAGLASGIADAVEFARRVGEFGMLILSINIFAQVLTRIVLINYYILMGPIIFACWGFPAGIGQKVVGQWFKGFVSLLAVQAVQIFVLTTLPFLIPPLPNLPTDSTFGLLKTLLGQLPSLIVLLATTKVPQLLGSASTKAIGKAGSMTAGAVVAIGGAAYSTV